MTTLKKKLLYANDQMYKTTESNYYKFIRQHIIDNIDDHWNGHVKIYIKISIEDIESFGKMRQGPLEHVNIADRICRSLNNDPYLKGFVFTRVGDGDRDSPVDIIVVDN